MCEETKVFREINKNKGSKDPHISFFLDVFLIRKVTAYTAADQCRS